MTDLARPVIMIPKITTKVMKVDSIGLDSLIELKQFCSKYATIDTMAINTFDKHQNSDVDINEDKHKTVETSTEPLIEPLGTRITNINRKTILEAFTHPKDMIIMETTFDRSSNISDKNMLNEIGQTI